MMTLSQESVSFDILLRLQYYDEVGRNDLLIPCLFLTSLRNIAAGLGLPAKHVTLIMILS